MTLHLHQTTRKWGYKIIYPKVKFGTNFVVHVDVGTADVFIETSDDVGSSDPNVGTSDID